MRPPTYVVMMVFTAFVAAAANAVTIHVPGDQATIQQGINAAQNGDTVLVAPGTYLEHLDFIGKAITVTSSGGAVVTVIDGGNVFDTPVVNFSSREALTSVLSGFTIRHASASFGAGVSLLGASATIVDNVFDSNSQGGGGFGAGIGGNGSSADIERNLFINNSCDGQFLSGVVSFVNTSSPKIINNIFADNPCRAVNMTLPQGSQPIVINNTMVRNNTGARVDARVPTGQQIYENNIIVANVIGLETQFGIPANNPTWSHNLVFGNGTNYVQITDQTGLNGNISADPLFLNSIARNFRPRSDSPAIDAGDNNAPGLPATDFAGNPRVVDGNGDGTAVVDMGAYEIFADFMLGAPSPNSVTMINGAMSPPISLTVSAMGDFSSTVTFSCSGLPAGASCIFSPPSIKPRQLSPANVVMNILTTTGTPAGTSPNVTISAHATGFPNPKNQNISLTVNTGTAATDMTLALSHSADPTPVGGIITFSATVNNAGAASAANVNLSTAFSVPVSVVSAIASQGACTGTVVISCNLGTMDASSSVTVTLQVRAPFKRSITATSLLTSDASDSNPNNNIASSTAQVRPRPFVRPGLRLIIP